MKYLDCVGLLSIEDRKLLLAYSQNKKAWYLPGGKVDPSEAMVPALQREIKEELNVDLTTEGLQWYCHIEAPAFGEYDTMMRQENYLYRLAQTPEPGSEIGAVRYFTMDEYFKETYPVVGVLMVFEKLRSDGLVD
jgi:8-oxo-dGTP pyrophosphatase MutT (NUDIX family)